MTRLFFSPVQREDLQKCARLLREGGLVVFPTETVYGLGANAFSDEAVRKIFQVKGRPPDNPLIVHIADISLLPMVAKNISLEVKRLFDCFSPGPLTVVCERTERISALVSAGLSTVGIRIPAHPIAQELLTLAEVPVAAPSANLSGRPSPTTFEMAVKEMEGRVDAIIDGEMTSYGLESTVVMVKNEKVVILRPGGITEEMLREKGFEVTYTEEKMEKQPLSPGMKYTHYKPQAEVYLSKEMNEQILRQSFVGKRVAVVGINPPPGPWERVVFENVASYAKGLFVTFFMLEQKGIEVIILQAVEEIGIGKALMNRMRKASGNRWLENAE